MTTTDFLTGTVKCPGEFPHEYLSTYKQICEKMPPLSKAAFLVSHLYGQKNVSRGLIAVESLRFLLSFASLFVSGREKVFP